MRFLSMVLLGVLSSSVASAAKHEAPARPSQGAQAVRAQRARRVAVAPMRQQSNLFRQSALDEANQLGLDRRFIGRLNAEVNAARRDMVRQRARFFKKIAVDRDFKGEHVLYTDADVTAFLDMTDPKHPRFNAEMESEEDLDDIPLSKRAHVLVVPNQPREHIASRLGGAIRSSDLEASLKVVKSAEQLAQRLGIKNARVYVSDSSNVMIGYLHVHIVGEKDPSRPYPQVGR